MCSSDLDYISSQGAQPGDKILLTKGAGVGAAALLACELRERLQASGVAEELLDRAAQRWREMSVVKEAGLVTAVGGVHAMHDATEGGVWRGLLRRVLPSRHSRCLHQLPVGLQGGDGLRPRPRLAGRLRILAGLPDNPQPLDLPYLRVLLQVRVQQALPQHLVGAEIGRASCRERV